MLTAFQNAFTYSLIQTAHSACVVNAAVHAVIIVAVTAEINVLDAPATCTHAQEIAKIAVVIH